MSSSMIRGWLQGPGILTATVVLWLIGTGCGFVWLMDHDFEYGRPSTGKVIDWTALKEATSDPFCTDDTIMVMAIHPRCPCTRASLNELELQLTRAQVPVRLYFLTYCDSSGEYKHTTITEKANTMPHSLLLSDPEGQMAKSFGLHQSGALLIGNSRGETQFVGGITTSRSCAGDNPGARAVHSILRGRAPESLRSPVFGCLIASKGK